MQNRGMYDEMELETVEKIGGRSGRDCFCGGSGRRLRGENRQPGNLDGASRRDYNPGGGSRDN